MFKYHRFLPQDVLNRVVGPKPIDIKPKEEKKEPIIKTDDKLIKQMIGGASPNDKTKNKIETEKEILPGTRLIEQYLKLDKLEKKKLK